MFLLIKKNLKREKLKYQSEMKLKKHKKNNSIRNFVMYRHKIFTIKILQGF